MVEYKDLIKSKDLSFVKDNYKNIYLSPEQFKSIKRKLGLEKKKKNFRFKRKTAHPKSFPQNDYFENYKDYCKSDWYKRLKKSVLMRDKNRCVYCKSIAETCHHKRYRKKWTRSRVEDCEAVCWRCHNIIHEDKKPITDYEYYAGI